MKAIITLLLLSNVSAIRLHEEPKEEAKDKKPASPPDCKTNPNAVNCRIGMDGSHVNIPLWKAPIIVVPEVDLPPAKSFEEDEKAKAAGGKSTFVAPPKKVVSAEEKLEID